MNLGRSPRVRFQHPTEVFFVGAGLTALVIDIIATGLHGQGGIIPIAYFGAVVMTVRVFWHWRTGRFQADIARALAVPLPAPGWLLFGTVLFFQAFFLKALPDLARSAPPVPCLCFTRRTVLAVLGLTFVGFMITVFESWVLFSAVLLVLRCRAQRPS